MPEDSPYSQAALLDNSREVSSTAIEKIKTGTSKLADEAWTYLSNHKTEAALLAGTVFGAGISAGISNAAKYFRKGSSDVAESMSAKLGGAGLHSSEAAAASLEHSTMVNGIKITAPTSINLEKAVASKPFTDWMGKMVANPELQLKSVNLQSVDMFGSRVGFLKLQAEVADKAGNNIPGIVFMRGNSVGILPVLSSEGKDYAVLTVQNRIPTAGKFTEIPAGMLDDSGNFAGVAAKELKEELGIAIKSTELTDLSKAFGHKVGFFPSPGGSDEAIRLFAFKKTVTPQELAAINNKATGVLAEGEAITTKVVPLEDLWKVNDAKTLIANSLYLKHIQNTGSLLK